jgi:hypothetical protein
MLMVDAKFKQNIFSFIKCFTIKLHVNCLSGLQRHYGHFLPKPNTFTSSSTERLSAFSQLIAHISFFSTHNPQ